MGRLDPQPWMTSPAARRVMDALNGARPDCARFVGGCVRNALLGEPVADVDIATQLVPELVHKVMIAAKIAVHPTGIEHGTLTVVSDHHPFEVTSLRQDVETDGRRAVVAFTDDWALDAQRRDFRMNALYATPDGELHDPTGGGLDDIASRRIIFVGDPETRIREDYLRILRFFRFQAWYGRTVPDAAGLAACAKLRGGLADISAERIWMETGKLLAAPQPLAALDAMESTGVLDQLFIEAKGLKLLRKLVGLDIREGFAPDPIVRFLALFWKDAAAVHDVANRMKMSNDERHRLNWAVQHDAPLWGGITEQEVRTALYLAGQQTIRDRLMLEWASDGSADWSDVLTLVDAWQRPVMPVTGADLLKRGVAQGPEIGDALRKLEAAWIDSDFTATHDELLAQLA
ncbi:MAG: CCA tRNA nucleotidyltransferase [Hyphomonadaceae bacterium]|jgi:poly(A) polymerase|nr:CCA tRNA nucleotidyltransferase [Hyphomonadaceae bacterium]MBP9235327.1 CCA tRNA nucleotidyltransferase [Hyphomonadaceae bacterium]